MITKSPPLAPEKNRISHLRVFAAIVLVGASLTACGAKKEECSRVIVAIHDGTMVKNFCPVSVHSTDEASVAAKDLDRVASEYEARASTLDALDVKQTALAKARADASNAIRAAAADAKKRADIARAYKREQNILTIDATECTRSQAAMDAALEAAGAACPK